MSYTVDIYQQIGKNDLQSHSYPFTNKKKKRKRKKILESTELYIVDQAFYESIYFSTKKIHYPYARSVYMIIFL